MLFRGSNVLKTIFSFSHDDLETSDNIELAWNSSLFSDVPFTATSSFFDADGVESSFS